MATDFAGGTFLSDVTSTAYMLGAFGIIDKTAPAMLNLFYPMQQQFDTAEIYWDQVQRARALAPLVRPTVAGKPSRSRGYSTRGLSPPYLKPKHIVEPLRGVRRRVGERLLGNLSPVERFELAIMDNMYLEDDSITRREEWMAIQQLLLGAFTMSGPDHEPINIDVGRLSSHTITLSGAAVWGATGVDPLSNLQDWATTVQVDSGFHPDTVVMDPKATRLFINSSRVLTIMQSYRQSSGNIDLAGRVAGGALGLELQYVGSLPGTLFEFWTYQQLWTDDGGTTHQLFPDYTVVMGNRMGAGGTRTYGAILDVQQMQAMPRFPKAWIEEDPSAWFTMMQSAPCPVLGWPNATFAATVVS